MAENINLDQLLKLILLEFGIKNINPSDCKLISLDIQKELNKKLSLTTIKRLFGFAESKNEFSKYTINTLLEYVNSKNINPTFPEIIFNENITAIREKAKLITLKTLNLIKNSCSLPYELTVGRKIATYDFDCFYESNKSFTCIISHPGYGKSILLSHLTNDILLNNNIAYKNDVIFFINAIDILDHQYSSISIENRIKEKLEFSENTNLIEYFNNRFNDDKTKLILIIDNFEQLLINKVWKPNIFEKIEDLIFKIDNFKSIKIILSMRCNTWNRFYEKIKFIPFLKEKWFQGSCYNTKENTNMPPLSDAEIDAFLKKINPLEDYELNPILKSQLKFPFHLEWYYLLKQKYPDFNSYTNIISYEIVDQFINNKIYLSNYASEKIFYCKKIIKLTNFGRRNTAALKGELIQESTDYSYAYRELLSDGILMEEYKIENSCNLEYVRFIQPYVFEYFLFMELLSFSKNKMDENFFENINGNYFGNQLRLQLLQRSVIHLIKFHELEQLKLILKMELNGFEKNNLIHFIVESLNFILKEKPTLLLEIKQKEIHKLLLRNLIHFDFVNSTYRETINTLLLTVDNEENAVLYHSILAISECLSLDHNSLLTRIEKLANYSYNDKKWIINPHETVRLIYLKTKGLPIVSDETIRKIEKFKNNPSVMVKTQRNFPSIHQVLSFLLILKYNLFYGSPKETIKIIASIQKLYPKIFTSRKPFALYLLNLLAHAKARSNPDEKTDQMERILTNIFENSLEENSTLYAKALFFFFKAQQDKNRKNYKSALEFAEKCVDIYEKNKMHANLILIYNFIISVYQEIDDIEKANNYIYIKLNLLEKKKINNSIFHFIN